MAKTKKKSSVISKKSSTQVLESRRPPVARKTSAAASHRENTPRATGKTGRDGTPRSQGATATKFTFYANPVLALVCVAPDAPVLFSLDAAAQLTEVHPDMIRYYCRSGLIEAIPGALETELFFDESSLHEIRRIEHYRRHLGVGRRALPLLCELRREGQRREIELPFLLSS